MSSTEYEYYTAELMVGACLCDVLLIIGYVRQIKQILPSIIIQICLNFTDKIPFHKKKCERGKQTYGCLSYQYLSQISNHNKLIPPNVKASKQWQSFIFGETINCTLHNNITIQYKIQSLYSNPACFYIGFVTKPINKSQFIMYESLGDGQNKNNSVGIYIHYNAISLFDNMHKFKKISQLEAPIKVYDTFTLKFDFNKQKCKLFYNGKKIKKKIEMNTNYITPALSLYYAKQEIQITKRIGDKPFKSTINEAKSMRDKPKIKWKCFQCGLSNALQNNSCQACFAMKTIIKSNNMAFNWRI